MTGTATQERPEPVAVRGAPDRSLHLIGVSLLGAVLWFHAASRIDLRSIGGLGLAGSLGIEAWTGLVVAIGAFVVAVTRPEPDVRVLALQLVVVVVMIDGLGPAIEPIAANPSTWIHIGFIDYILNHGSVYPHFDARFSWPGAFAFGGLLTRTAGRHDAQVFAHWCPLFIDLLLLFPLRLIVRAFAKTDTVAWVAMLVFVLGNWFGQDYLSPQAVAYLLALVIIGAAVACSPAPALDHLRTLGARAQLLRSRLVGTIAPFDLPTARQRRGLVLVLAAITVAIAVSHQLTPFALLVVVAVLVVGGMLRWRTLPIFVVLTALAWLSLGASDFWVSHLSSLTGGVSSASTSLQQNLTGRTHGSDLHLFTIAARLAVSAGLLGLAAFGSFRRHRRGERGWALELLAIAPFSLVLIQSYGGEMLIRANLFALPFIALLVAAIPRTLTAWNTVKLALGTSGLAILALLLVVSRSGNEPFTLNTHEELTAVETAYRLAVPGSRLAVMSQNLPWRFRDIDRVETVSYERLCGAKVDLDCLSRVGADLVIVTRNQQQYAELVQHVDPARWTHVLDDVLPAAGYRVVYKNRDASIYSWSGVGPTPAANGTRTR